MRRSGVIGHMGLAALAIGLPLTSAAAGSAAPGPPPAPDGVCRAAFGVRGPAGGAVVGEGPSGDPMSVTVAWDPGEWPTGLREIATCLSVGGHALPELSSITVAPPNAGSVTVNFTLPAGTPGSLVCEESVLVGTGSTEGRSRPTEAVCFKLRAAEDAAAPGGAGATAPDGSPLADRPHATPPAVLPPMTPAAPHPPVRIRRPETPPAAGPPIAPPAARRPVARPVAPPAGRAPAAPAAPTELARRFPAGLLGPVPEPLPAFGPPVAPPPADGPAVPAGTAPAVPAALVAPGRAALGASARAARPPSGLSASRPAPARVGSAVRARPLTSDGRPLVAPPALPATGGGPVAALPRTGLGSHIPLAGAGGLLAIGGAAILLGEPRRRSRRPRRA